MKKRGGGGRDEEVEVARRMIQALRGRNASAKEQARNFDKGEASDYQSQPQLLPSTPATESATPLSRMLFPLLWGGDGGGGGGGGGALGVTRQSNRVIPDPHVHSSSREDLGLNKVVIPPPQHFETGEVKGDSKVKKRKGRAMGKAPFLKSWLRQKEHQLRHAQQQQEPGAAPPAGGCDGRGEGGRGGVYSKARADEGERGSTPVPIAQEISTPVPVAGLNLGLEISTPVPIASLRALYSQMLHFVTAGPVYVTSYQPSPVHGGQSGGGGGRSEGGVGGDDWPSAASFCSTATVTPDASATFSPLTNPRES